MCFPQSGKYFASSPGGIASTRYHNQVLPIELFVYTVDAALVVAVLHLQATQRVHVSTVFRSLQPNNTGFFWHHRPSFIVVGAYLVFSKAPPLRITALRIWFTFPNDRRLRMHLLLAQ